MNKHGRINLITHILILSMLLSGIIYVPITAQEESINKVYCNATLEDEFDDNKVIIIVMPEHNFESYTVSDFSDINCVEIIDRSVNVKKENWVEYTRSRLRLNPKRMF